MNISQKEMIIALCTSGMTYQQIAERTNTSVVYCRSVCSTSKKAKKPVSNETADADLCRYCGQPLFHITGCKKKQFCSDQCRHAFYNRTGLHKPYVRICEYCGKEFVSYGYPKKRFCSRDCQTLAGRKGSEDNAKSIL